MVKLTESKYLAMRRAMVAAECGDSSEGFSITQLPAAIAPVEYRKKLNISDLVIIKYSLMSYRPLVAKTTKMGSSTLL